MLQKEGSSPKAGASLQTSLIYGITGGGILGIIEILTAWPIYYWKLPGPAQLIKGPVVYMAAGVAWGTLCHIILFILGRLQVYDDLPSEADCFCGAADIALAIAVWVAVWSGRIFLADAKMAVIVPYVAGLALIACTLAWLLYKFLKWQKGKDRLFISYSILSVILYLFAAVIICLNTIGLGALFPSLSPDMKSDTKAINFSPVTARNRPNIILITPDTLRSDHLGCYGYTGIKTPAIDSLSADGVLFEKAISAAPWTLPSFASLFSSLYPTVHGAGKNQAMENNRIAAEVILLPQILKEAGYYTKAIVNIPVLDELFGFGRGFDDYKDRSSGVMRPVIISKREELEKRTAPLLWAGMWEIALKREVSLCRNLSTTDEAVQWLEQNRQYPFFFWIHYYGVHFPYEECKSYDLDPEYRGKLTQMPLMELIMLRDNLLTGRCRLNSPDKNHLRAMYDGELQSIDEGIGRILDKLRQFKLLDNTMIIFASDHGEEFWEHGGFEHGHTLYRELLQVPLIIKWPGVLPAGKVVKDQVRIIDVMPTILELLDIKHGGNLTGRSLLPLIKGEEQGDRTAFSESLCYYEERKTVSTGKYKLIYTPDSGNTELYDIEADPGEQYNIAAQNPAETSRLKEQLLDWVRDGQVKVSALRNGKETATVKVEEVMQRLKSLGYM